LVGSGRTEIAGVLFGVDQPSAGHIQLEGEDVSFADPAAAMIAGVVYVSEDRLGQSLVMEFSILAREADRSCSFAETGPLGLSIFEEFGDDHQQGGVHRNRR